jgi:hypothetical protein
VSGPAARLIADALAQAADAYPTGATRIIAVGWATVDLDRAISEVLRDLELPLDAFTEAIGSSALGARGRIARAALDDGTAVAILEPTTEGRLAAILARHGEGPAAVWLVAQGEAIGDVRLDRSGPFGPERVVPGGLLERVVRFLVLAEPGTIGA